MAFNDDRIHGWNVAYRDIEANPAGRFRAFQWLPQNRPGQFNNQQVQGAPQGIQDHQGHIVPDNKLSEVLTAIAKAAAEDPGVTTLTTLNTFLTKKYQALNFNNVTNYIQKVLIGGGKARETNFVDPEEQGIDRFRGYFSVIVWNPLNLCRAPSDEKRKVPPGNKVDVEVIKFLLDHKDYPGITLLPAMAEAFKKIMNSNPPSEAALKEFIGVGNASLVQVTQAPQGFYKFDWQGGEKLEPRP